MHHEAVNFLLWEGTSIDGTVSMSEYKYYKISINDEDVS